MGKTLNGGSRGATRGQARRFPGKPAADEQERDEERPRGQVVSERHAAQSVDVAHTQTRMQTHTGEQKSPSLVPARHQMAHLFGPAAQRDARLAVPTDRRPSSPQVPWQAGGQAGASPRRRSNSHSSRCSAVQKRKSPPTVNPTDQELSRPLRRFKDGDALRRRIPAVSAGEAPLFCRSKRARGLSKTGVGADGFIYNGSTGGARAAKTLQTGTYTRGEMIHRSLRGCVTSRPRLRKQHRVGR